MICLHRKVATRDHKLVYWFAGAIAASSVLLEKKARRAELALYVLPRAADSLWYILNKRHLIPNIKNTEVSLSLSHTSLMHARAVHVCLFLSLCVCVHAHRLKK